MFGLPVQRRSFSLCCLCDECVSCVAFPGWVRPRIHRLFQVLSGNEFNCFFLRISFQILFVLNLNQAAYKPYNGKSARACVMCKLGALLAKEENSQKAFLKRKQDA